jgi:spore coat polysaccharide biosynthesis protein SpsF
MTSASRRSQGPTKRRYRIVLQARTTSNRLQAKVLLPIGGLPLAILCAKRLHNTGRDVVLATSDAETDDALARLATREGVRVCRGSLEDVLSRFVHCTADLADEDVVVRTTADNPLPDGSFVDMLVERFERCRLAYLGTSSPSDGLPFGLSGEVFTAGALRRAAEFAGAGFEREHVTPVIRRLASPAELLGPGEIVEGDHAHLRCTVDTLEDYLRMTAVFSSCSDPIGTPWQSLLRVLPNVSPDRTGMDGAADETPAAPAIMLGTAQLGMKYGIANRAGCLSDSEAISILALALSSGVNRFDTARSYGKSESRIGSALSHQREADTFVVTKLLPLAELADDASMPDIARFIEASVFRSCHELRRRRLDVVMFHRCADMVRWNGAATNHLELLADEGVVGEIGVSVYQPEEAIRCIADMRVKHLQIPFNLLDKRWASVPFTAALDRRPDLRVHVRSVFLQGLLTSDATVWPAWASCGRTITDRIAGLCTKLGRHGPSDLCMAYVRAFPWVTTLVLGVERRDQLEELLQNAQRRPLSLDEVKEVQATFPDVPDRLLNPAQWPQ